MSEDRITFKCNDCGHPVSIDKSNPPDDDDILTCFGCGREFGRYAEVKKAMIAATKAEVERLVEGRTGQRPAWEKRPNESSD